MKSILTAACVAILACACSPTEAPAPETTPPATEAKTEALPKQTCDIAAKVDDAVLTTAELEKQLDALTKHFVDVGMLADPTPEELAHLRDSLRGGALETFVTRQLFRKAASELQITVTDADREEVKQKLAEVEGVPVEEVLDRHPMPREEALAQLDDSIRMKKVIKVLGDRLPPLSDAEVAAQHAALQAAAAEVEAKLNGFLKDLADGKTTFETLVQEHSIVKGPMPVVDEVAAREFSPEIAKAILSLPVGGVSEILHDDRMRLVLKVNRRTSAQPAEGTTTEAQPAVTEVSVLALQAPVVPELDDLRITLDENRRLTATGEYMDKLIKTVEISTPIDPKMGELLKHMFSSAVEE